MEKIKKKYLTKKKQNRFDNNTQRDKETETQFVRERDTNRINSHAFSHSLLNFTMNFYHLIDKHFRLNVNVHAHSITATITDAETIKKIYTSWFDGGGICVCKRRLNEWMCFVSLNLPPPMHNEYRHIYEILIKKFDSHSYTTTTTFVILFLFWRFAILLLLILPVEMGRPSLCMFRFMHNNKSVCVIERKTETHTQKKRTENGSASLVK